MANYTVTTVDEFIEAAPETARPHLRKIRKIIEDALPSFEKEIGYGKPFYKYHGWVVGMDVYKQHLGVEIWDGLSDETRKQLEKDGYKTGSVTFQIRYDQKIPVSMIRELVKAQAMLNESKSKK